MSGLVCVCGLAGPRLRRLFEEVISPDAINAQRAWSDETFGPGARTAGVLAHIRKELDEIAADPADLNEWVDVIILAVDGATRAGHSGQALVAAYHSKMAKNRARTWPDWRDFDEDQPIEHVRGADD